MMPEFTKYPHIERLGSDDVDGITVGKCYVFPKIDGTQSSVWLDADGSLCAGSRRRTLSLEDDNAGFMAHVLTPDVGARFHRLIAEHGGNWVVYAEWLVPHSLKTYRDDAWRKVYVFDIYDTDTEKFIDYDTYAPILDAYDITYIPVLEVVTNPSEEHLLGLLDRNTYLIKDGCGVGEGIVIKRYDFVNQWGRTTWAKIVRNEFKEQNAKAFGHKEVDMMPFEARLAQEFVTVGRVTKLKDRMREDGPLNSRRIPELLNRTWHDVITEEMWNILKKHKDATIDFKLFQQHVVAQVKEYTPELFGQKGDNE